eukprot:CAMPEP_0178522734 /NCGR_PEP_ID=MMETSP0696-20121128/28705_1 /TAXON_ID=265572 /ORGANISM="Extubocellulus spinifer, Strain CCMP396" /LENGTH=350 /DNA_ID=CAMNT_0020153897 /DNA_START=982 /DNA_END=2030 /DNA_ORIENTATION=+
MSSISAAALSATTGISLSPSAPLPPAPLLPPPKPPQYEQLFLSSNSRRRRRLQRPPLIRNDGDDTSGRQPSTRIVDPGDLLVIALRQTDFGGSDQTLSDDRSSGSSEHDERGLTACLCTASSSFANRDDATSIDNTSDRRNRRRTINFDPSTSFPLSSDCLEVLRREVGFGDWKRVYDIVEDPPDDTAVEEDVQVSTSSVGRGESRSVHVVKVSGTTTKQQEKENQKGDSICGGVYVTSKRSARLRPLLSLTMSMIRDVSRSNSTTEEEQPSSLSPLMTSCAKRLMAGRVILRGCTTVLNLPKVGVHRGGESVLQIRLCAEGVQPHNRRYGTGSSSYCEDNEPYIVLPST